MKVNGIELLQMIKDGKIQDKTIIKSQRNELEFVHTGHYFKTIDEYYIFNSYEGKFHRCDKNGKLGAKGQTRFMHYEILYKDFEIIEPTEGIEKLDIQQDNKCFNYYIQNKNGTKCYLTKHSKILSDKVNELVREVNHLKRNE